MWLTREQAREIDRRSIETYGIPSIVLMENASRGLADMVLDELRTRHVATNGEIVILCGGGNNGGDGLAAARHLHNAGCSVQIGLTIDPAGYRGDAATNFQIVSAMGLSTFVASPEAIANQDADLIVDAIFGTGLSKPPRDPFGMIAAAVEATCIPVIAVDLPSGLDCDTGLPLGVAIRAQRTVTFVAEKFGFRIPTSPQYTGEITVVDIGCPIELIAEIAGANR